MRLWFTNQSCVLWMMQFLYSKPKCRILYGPANPVCLDQSLRRSVPKTEVINCSQKQQFPDLSSNEPFSSWFMMLYVSGWQGQWSDCLFLSLNFIPLRNKLFVSHTMLNRREKKRLTCPMRNADETGIAGNVFAFLFELIYWALRGTCWRGRCFRNCLDSMQQGVTA